MKRRTLLSLVGIGLATQTAGCMGNEPAETESDETADQDQSSEDQSSENVEAEQDAENEEPIISDEEESETQQQQEQDKEGETEEENNNEQDKGDEPQDDTDESTADVSDMWVFVEHAEKREVIPGATVIIRHQEQEDAQWQETTDTHRDVDGAFASFTAIPTGIYSVVVRAEGFTETSGVVELTEEGLEPTFQLSPAESTVLFTVIDQYGDPVSGAKIDVTYDISKKQTVTTDEYGEARFTAPERGEYTYSVRADGFQTPTPEETVTIEEDEEIEIEIEEETFTLTVEIPEGNGLVGLQRERDYASTTEVTDQYGMIEFDVYPGEYQVTWQQNRKMITVPETTSVTFES